MSKVSALSPRNLRWHIGMALALAFFFRALTAFFNYGPQSVDDYDHGLIPAWEVLRGLPLELPTLRSPILVWSLMPFAWLGKILGLTVSFDIFRIVMLGLGIFSLWMIWAYGRYAERNSSLTLISDRPVPEPADPALAKRLILIPLYLLSLHFILSFAVTRAFGESVAMTLVFVSLLWMDESLSQEQKSTRWHFFAGAFLLGLACLYRFQIGLLGVGYAAYLAYTRRWTHFGLLALAGVLTAVIEALKDLAFGRYPFETLAAYFYANRDGAVAHSVQPWYNTWTTVLVMFLIPLSLPFFKNIGKSIRIERVLWGLILFFTFMHSLIPHKEERFLYPILPLVLFLLGRLWAKFWGHAYEKWIFRPVVFTLLGIGLAIATISNSQSGEYEPILRADRYAAMVGPVKIWDRESLLEKSFFRHRLIISPVQYEAHSEWPDPEELESSRQTGRGLMLVTSNPDLAESMQAWILAAPMQLECRAVERIQSVGDRLIYARNPRYNVRRKPTWISLCSWSTAEDREH